MEAAYPNPFNPTTTISFGLPQESHVVIDIYDIKGQKVEEIINQNMLHGTHSIVWNADSHSSGVYFIKMLAGEYISTQKLLLVK